MHLHELFDALALIAGLALHRFLDPSGSGAAAPVRRHPAYLSTASFGMIAGALAAGTGNLWLTHVHEVGKSVIGGLAGAILAIELLKAQLGLKGATGLRFVARLAAAIAVGRVGRFLGGLDDMTHGTPTGQPWGDDFGDGIPRHPMACRRR